MKYAVVGFGAVGSVIGGLLLESGEDVLFIVKEYKNNIFEKKELRIKNYTRNTIILKNIKLSSNFKDLKDIDVIFICVKSQDTKDVAKNLRNNIKKSAQIITLQNGVKNASILESVTKNKVISGVILFNSVFLKPGEVDLTIKGGLLIEDSKIIDLRFLKDLRKAGFKIKLKENIKGYLYSKLIVDLQIAVTCLTGQTIVESITNNISRKIIVSAMKEGIHVLEKSGIKLQRLPEIDPIKIIKRLDKYNSFILKIGSRLIGIKANARNSMWQSLVRGKTTEIDFINGEIVDIARKNNFDSPINSRLVELVKKLEKQKNKNYIKPYELKNILDL